MMACLRFWATLLCMLIPLLATAGDDKGIGRPLVFGLMPYLNTRTLMANYQPLAANLEKELQAPVTLQTAPDFDTFVKRVFDGDYDLVLLAPHYARLAEREFGYVPLLVHKAPIRSLLVTARDKPLTSVAELRGQTIAVVERSALIAIMGAAWLAEEGLREGNDYRFVETVTHTSALYNAATGKARAAIVSHSTLILAPQDLQREIVIFREIAQIPGQFVLAHSRLSGERRQAVKAALLRFEKSAEGQLFFERTSHGGYREESRDDIQLLDRLLPETRRQIGNILR